MLDRDHIEHVPAGICKDRIPLGLQGVKRFDNPYVLCSEYLCQSWHLEDFRGKPPPQSPGV